MGRKRSDKTSDPLTLIRIRKQARSRLPLRFVFNAQTEARHVLDFMSPLVALILCSVLVAVLLRIEHRRNPETSVALWVPTFWLLLCGSKPLGKWFEPDAILASFGSDEAGSPYDRLVLSILIILAVVILRRRKIAWSPILKDNFWLILLFLYLGSSILWSDFALVSSKRWMRLAGAIPIAMVVLSERSPFDALESVFRRSAYVLIPFSLLLIKYFPRFGIQYSAEGTKMWVGVASQKNSLGVICAISTFLIVWTFLREWRAGSFLKTKSQTLAEGLVLAIALRLLMGFRGAYPATAVGFLIAGMASALFLCHMKSGVRLLATLMVLVVAGGVLCLTFSDSLLSIETPIATGFLMIGISSLPLLYWVKCNVRHMATFLVFMLASGVLCLTFADSLVPIVTSVFQRNETFTGRSDIWRMVTDVASRNPWFGVGYGGYWGLQDKAIFSSVLVREAHSGYLDVFLEVGGVGITLLLAFLLSYHRRALRELNHAYDWGLFGICLLIMTLMHNFTESNFLRTSSYFWNVTVFLAIVLSVPCLPTSRNGLSLGKDTFPSNPVDRLVDPLRERPGFFGKEQ